MATMDNGYSSEKIIRIIKEIRADNRPNRLAFYKEKYNDFLQKFPKLFFAAFNDTFDIRMLEMMLSHRNTIMKNKNKETLDHVSEQVHETLNEKYVYPVIPKSVIDEMKAGTANLANV